MMPELFLDTKDELKLYLAKNALLPVAKIKLSLDKEFINFYDYHETRFKVGTHEAKTIFLKNVSNETIDKFKKYMKDNDLYFIQTNPKPSKQDLEYVAENTIFTRNTYFLVSQNKKSLDELMDENTTPLSKMILLGWPATDAIHYKKQRQVNDFFIDNNYLLVNLAKAKRYFLKIPSWGAYLFFVPHLFDVVDNKFSQTARDVCLSYQQFTRENNPDLAKRIESEFKNREYDFSWHLLDNMQYKLSYDGNRINKKRRDALLKKIN